MANINGTNAANTLNGTNLDDVIRGLGGNDTINAGDGNDVLDGGNGADLLYGGQGNDQIFGGAGNDRLFGGDGDDLLDGGSGTDWADFSGGGAVNVDLTAGVATGQGNDRLFNIERVAGSSFGDVLKGSMGSDVIQGGAGNDLLIATAGTDTLNGGADIDTVSFASFASGVTASLSSGAYSSASGTGSLTSVENLIGSDTNDTLTGSAGANTLNGGLGSDTLNGGAGIDTLSYEGNQSHNFIDLEVHTATQQWLGVSVGTDTISNFENVTGGDNFDRIRGDAGNNILHGGGSSDELIASLGVDHLDGDTGANDTVYFTYTGAVTASLATNDYVIDANNNGTMANIDHLAGSAGNDVLTGDAANNYLMGRGGDDVLAGGLGNDELWGGAGSDRLIADGGNDLLVGDYDRLDGHGDGASDVFEVRTSAGYVTIQDFVVGVDKLDLTAFGFDQNGHSSYWSGSVAQVGANQELTLTGLGNETVKICLVGFAEGEALTVSDMIGGSQDLVAQTSFPINGGNGQADIFEFDYLNGNVIVNGSTVILGTNGNVTITGFENGLDQMDINDLINAGWDGYLGTAPDGSAVLHFEDFNGHEMHVTLEGVSIGQIDPSDYVF